MPLEGLLGRKLGMTQIFDKDGQIHDVTVVEAGPVVVTQVKSPEKDGYAAVQVGYGDKKNLSKPMRGHLKKLGNFRLLREFRVRGEGEYSVGDSVGIDLFAEGDLVDVIGVSRGRGFAGGVRRWGFRGGPKTHGQSDRHRAPGSIGSGTTPGRVYKGQHMAGHMGAHQVTSKNLRVIAKDEARNLLMIEGAVPGATNGTVRVCHAKKRAKSKKK
ncbi:MAG TPA: 50S ribosomal protein L3 [Dehalococcoidia bacterium]|nr:50S ribosomal protein L3 [Dehalococcoidia bacterium]